MDIETSPGVDDAPEVEEVPEEIETETPEIELDDDGNPIDPDQADDDTDEIEKDGEKYRIPKALKDNFLMHKDYTHKTQALAEKERQIEAAFQQHNAVSAVEMQTQAHIIALDAQIAEAQQIDWQAWNQTNPAAASAAFMEYSGLKEQRQALLGKYGQARQQRTQIEQQETARRIGQAQAEVAKVIPDWNEGKAAKLLEFGQKHYGFTAEELNGIDDPRVVRALNDAFELVQAAAKSKTVKKVQTQQAVKPAGKVTGSAAPVRALDDRTSTDAWMKARQKQISSR